MTTTSPTIKFRGNINNAKIYKSYGLQAYSFLVSKSIAGGVNFLHDDIELEDGTLISITTNVEGVYGLRYGIIEITGVEHPSKEKEYPLYMESGILQHGSSYINNEDSWKPSIIRFNDFTYSQSELLPNASSSREVTDKEESWAVGCNGDKVDDIIAMAGLSGDIYHFHSDEKIYCKTVQEQKYAQTACPASAFTGKLRLMVQAVYGTVRDDYKVNQEQPFNYPYLLLEDVRLESGGITSSGLYTDPLGNYWIISMGTAIYAQKLEVDEDIKISVERLRKSKDIIPSDDIDLSEAYLLGNLKSNKKNKKIYIGDQTHTYGYSEIAWGWKFNNKGDEVSIVVHKVENIPVHEDYSTSLYNMDCFNLRLVTVKLGFDYLTKQPTILSSEVVKEGFHIPYAQTKVFVPVYPFSIMRCLIAAPPYSASDNFIAPIYCYYNRNDTLEVIEVQNGRRDIINHTPIVEFKGNPRWETTGGTGYLVTDWVAPGYMDSWTSKSFTQQNGVLTTAPVPQSFGISETYSSRQVVAKWIELDGEITGGVLPFSEFSGYIGNKESTKVSKDSFTHYNISYGSIQKSFNSIIIIPFTDSEAVVVVGEVSDSFQDKNKISYYFGNNIWWTHSIWSYDSVGGQVVWNNQIYDRPEYSSGGIENWSTLYYNTPLDSGEKGVNAYFNIPDFHFSKSQIGTLLTSTGKVDIYEDHRIDSAVFNAPFFSFYALFGISYKQPFFLNRISVYSGYSSGKRWDMPGDFASGNEDWPDGLGSFFSIVGWN